MPDHENVPKQREADEDRTIEDDALEAKRNNALRHGALMHNPQDTFDAVARAAEGYRVTVNAISGPESLTPEARAELDRLGIDPDHVRAWYSSKEDAVYVNAARVRSSEVPYLLLHEVAVHKGLPAVLGDQYDAVMDSIYGQFREEIETVNELYHYDLESEDERRMATEEYLAERAEFCGHDWRAYAESHEEEIEEYIAEHGLSRENRKGAVRGLMAENGELELRPSRWKEFLQRVKMFFRKRKGFENYRFTDQEIETLIMRGLRKARGKNKPDRPDRPDRQGYTLENAIASKEGYRVERVNENAGAEFNELQGVICKDLPGAGTWTKEQWIAYMSENGIIGKHSVPALEGRLVEVRGNLPKRLKGHSAYQDKLSMISIIPEMLENAVLVQSEGKPREGHFDNIKSHILAVKVRIGDGDSSRRYVVGMVIHEDSNGNLYYEHELTDIQKYADSAANQGHNLAGTPSASVMNIIRKSLLSSGFDAKNEKNTRFSVDQTETEEFKRWFGDSKVVDENGEPLVVYHGTLADFTEFRKDHIGSRYSYDDRGFFFLDRKSIADDYARSEFDSSRKGKVLACYVSLQKPLIIDRKWTLKNSLGDVFRDNDVIDFWDAYQPFVMDEVDRAKADGVIVKDGKTTMVVAFEPNQIKSATDNIGTYDPGNPDIRFSVVEDEETLDKLNKAELEGEYLTLYRAAQLRDGKLYPPMAGKINGEWQEPIKLGEWEQADEHPELIVQGNKFNLNKGNGASVPARYNPYFHSSPTPLNDQFASAYKRPELVTLEVRVPKSELTSGYRAEHAKDSVGMKQWKSGVVQGKLGGTRQVMLSRWDKPVRIVPDSEVAAKIAEMLEGEGCCHPGKRCNAESTRRA